MKISPTIKKGRLRTRVVRDINSVPAAQWNKIFPDVPENFFFLKTLLESRFEQFSFYYILVYEHKELVGAAPCFFVNYSLDTSINGPLRRVTNGIKRFLPGIFSVKAIVCGIPMGQGQMGLQGSNPASTLAAIEKRLEALARKLKAPFIAFKDFDASYDNTMASLLSNGYLKMDSLPLTRMKIDFPDFEGFLKTLGSATRYDLRRKFKRIGDVKIDFKISTRLDEQTLDEVYGLYMQAVETHDMGFEIVPKDFFNLISQNMPHETKFFLWRMDGKLVAFTFALHSGDVLLDYYLGFDPSAGHQFHLYFVRTKAIIEWCIANRVKSYEMGATGYEPKRRLRFEFIPVFLYVKIRYKIMQPGLKLLCTLLKFENFDPVIKEWKKSLNSTSFR